MDILIKALQFFLSLTILVTIHELGHFLVARLFRIRVEKFYIFFDAGFRLFHFRRGETEYGLGWLPLGGYCKISGMIDESMDKESLKLPPKPYEFRSKPAWQRFFVLVAGVTMNVLLAFVIYSAILYTCGSSYISNQDNPYGYSFNEAAKGLGLRDGDRIMSINEEKIERYDDIFKRIMFSEEDLSIDVIRGGAPQNLQVRAAAINALRQNDEAVIDFVSLRIPFIIDSVVSNEARIAGLMHGDAIVGIDDEEDDNFLHYARLLSERAGKEVSLHVLRDTVEIRVNVPVSLEGKIGVTTMDPQMPVRQQEYSLFSAIPAGVHKCGEVLSSYCEQLALIVKPKTGLYKQVGGFISIGNIFPAQWDWLGFWSMTAFLSIVLAVMNIIPIPGLDGGHTLFTLWEMITRRKPSDKFLEVMQYIGLALILMLLIFANGNDINRFFLK